MDAEVHVTLRCHVFRFGSSFNPQIYSAQTASTLNGLAIIELLSTVPPGLPV